MNSTRSQAGPKEAPAWVTPVSEVFDHIYLVLRVNACWWLLSLLGLLVFGVGPASCAAADAFRAARHGERVRVLPLMWSTYRAHLVSANVRMIPLLIVQAGSVAMVWLMANGVVDNPVPAAILGSLAAASAGWATTSLGAIAVSPRVRSQDLLVTWRLALLLPGVLLLRAIPMGVLLVAWLLVSTYFAPIAVLLGAGVAINIVVAMLARRIDQLLEDLHRQQPAAG